MKTISFLASLLLLATSAAWAAQPIKADSMGLSKTSVFDTPQPTVYSSKANPAGANTVLPRAYLGAPPQIPHLIEDYLPITADTNMCMACHDQPERWGLARQAGEVTPIPVSHYTDQRNAPGKVSDHVIKVRYNCNQCHVPQEDAKALVKNTFGQSTKRK